MVKYRFKIVPVIALLVIPVLFAASCGGKREESEGSSATSASPQKRGEEIVAEYLKRDAAPYRKMRVRFTIRAEDDPEKIYELDNWRKQTPEGTTTLTQIVKPAEDSDLGSLTLELKDQKATVATYAKSRDEFRETDTKKMFFGGLTAGELLGEWNKFSYTLAGEKELDGRKVFEVEGNLKPGTDSIVSRLNVLFRSDNYVPAELHLFDNSGREIRAYRVTEFKDDPEHPYAVKTEVENPIYKAKILIEILSREFPAAIEDAMFSRDKLKQFAQK
jgi:Outer membrane lipoprotein-sorting protein